PPRRPDMLLEVGPSLPPSPRFQETPCSCGLHELTSSQSPRQNQLTRRTRRTRRKQAPPRSPRAPRDLPFEFLTLRCSGHAVSRLRMTLLTALLLEVDNRVRELGISRGVNDCAHLSAP